MLTFYHGNEAFHPCGGCDATGYHQVSASSIGAEAYHPDSNAEACPAVDAVACLSFAVAFDTAAEAFPVEHQCWDASEQAHYP